MVLVAGVRRSGIAAVVVSLVALGCTGHAPLMPGLDPRHDADGGPSSPGSEAATADVVAADAGTPDVATPDAGTVDAADGGVWSPTVMLASFVLEDSHCGLKASGELRCWSNDKFFESLLAPFIAQAPPGLVKIAVSDTTSSDPSFCGIDSQGRGTCWGRRTWMDLGSGVVSVALTRYGPCALYEDGRVVCSAPFTRLPSDRRYLQMATAADFLSAIDDTGWPVDLAGGIIPPGVYRRIAKFSSSTALLRDDGALVHLGWPESTVIPGRFVDLSYGVRHLCGIDESAEIRCFPMPGAIGAPLSPPPGPFVQIASGYNSMCGRRPGGSTTCWGEVPVRLPYGW